MLRRSTVVGLVVALTAIVLGLAAGCGGGTSLGGDEGVPDTTADEAPDVAPDGSGDDAGGDEARDARDAFPDPGSDPGVPESWDVPFEYMDIPPDYVPDAASCGNGVVDPGEECDDGNADDHDECTTHCLFPRCGDGVVWYALESCDPPGSARPCTTSCGSTGGEFCEPFCRWTGTCVPPVESCGNGADDDCDGVTDRIVRRTENLPLADRDAVSGATSAIAATSDEWAIAWWAYPGVSVLSRLDSSGSRVDWDRDLGESEPRWGDGLLWDGAALGFVWEDYIPGPGHDIPRLRFQATDSTGTPLAPAQVLCSEETAGSSCRDALAAAFPGGWATVRGSGGATGIRLLTISNDGTTILGDSVVAADLYVPYCVAWTGSELAVLAGDSAVGPATRLLFVSSTGAVRSSVDVALGSLEYRMGCAWTSAGLVLLAGTSSGTSNVSLHAIAPDGAVLREEPIAWRGIPDAALIWSGSELGIVGSDNRSGNHEIYFVRARADGTLLPGEARVTRTPAESTEPRISFLDGAYGVVWTDSDGVDAGPYFATFTVCP